jgi:hypothetical protein
MSNVLCSIMVHGTTYQHETVPRVAVPHLQLRGIDVSLSM